MEITRARFTVHSFDADAFGLLSPPAVAGFLQEAAGRSADGLGFGLGELQRRGLTWVLARQWVVLDAPVRLGEELTVETWPSGVERLAAFRDFRLRRGEAEVGRAVTTWYALDLATRRPARVDELLPPQFHARAEHVLPVPRGKLPELAAPEVERRFRVRFADIDVNEHVTNASYVAWALEAVEESTWRSERVVEYEAAFLAECRWGGAVLSRSVSGELGARLHAVVREEDGVELARLVTRWAKRGG